MPIRTMSESIVSLYESFNKILDKNSKLNLMSMNITHQLGYNGFKRWHRYRTRQFNELKICLENELFDKFRIKHTFQSYDISYVPTSIENHLNKWNDSILSSLEELGKLNQEFYELVGMNNCLIEKTIKILCRDFEKTGRLISRFKESEYLSLDVYIVDDCLHKKFKKKELKNGFKY